MSRSDWKSQYPFSSRWLTLPAGRYHFLDEGQGEPLLMVHGNPTWSFYWRRLVLAFRDRFRAVAPDHLGCGLSDKPQDGRAAIQRSAETTSSPHPVQRTTYTLQDHIDRLVSLIDHLNLEQITLLGHDWGGPIGLGAALARPERFRRFVLLNTGAFPPPYIPARIRVCRIPLLGPLAVRGLNLFSRAALRMAVADPKTVSPEFRAGMLAPYDSWRNRVGVLRFVQDIPASPAHPTWQTLERIEEGLTQLSTRPFQLIWGMRDWCFTPECLRRLRERIPNAHVVELPEAGHWVVEEAHDQVRAALESFFHATPSPCDRTATRGSR